MYLSLCTLALDHRIRLDIGIMSLQHVLEVARKNGMPVIITDVGGREPMVILPLEQFEALTQSTQSSAPSPQLKELESLPEVEVNPDMALEERFDLEPLEDK